MPSAAVIVPTTGAPEVRQAIASLLAQSHADLRIYLVVDGPAYEAPLRQAIAGLDLRRLRLTVLPENTGAGGYHGHRIYAAFSHLVSADYLLFLDEDNWFEPDHVAAMVETVEAGALDWCWCLRRVMDRLGRHLIDDDCINVGPWSPLNLRLVDTSAYCLRRPVAAAVSAAWQRPWTADRACFARLEQQFPAFACTGRRTLNYRISLKPGSANLELFERGNALSRQRYPQGFPWAAAPKNLPPRREVQATSPGTRE